MNDRMRMISLRSVLSLVLFGALLGLLVTTSSPSRPILAESTILEAPTVQIRTPENGALITQSAGTMLVISGFAWDSSNDPGFPDDPVLNLISNPSNVGNYFVSWTAAPGALNYVLEESTSPYFDKNVITYPSTTALNQFITGKTNGTYYYRLMAFNIAGNSRWSNVVSTQVGAGVAVTDASLAQLALPVVEVSINEGPWQAATVAVTPSGYWSWSFNWTLPEEDNVALTIRARGQSGLEIGPEDAITVTIDNNLNLVYLPLVIRRWPPVPYPPTLNEISNADLDGNYTVSWSYSAPGDVPLLGSYTLQESTSADFSTALQEFPVYSVSRNFTNQPSGTYYYRVRGNNVIGPGEWSVIRSVVVAASTTDDFSDANSGWARATYKRSDGGDLMNVDYAGGTYRMKIMLATGNQNNHKMGLAKAPDRFIHSYTNYDVSVSHFFAQAEMPFPTYKPLEGKAGIVFGANADYTTLYVFEWNWNGLCAVNRYNTVSWPVSGYTGFGGTMTTTPFYNWAACNTLLGNDYNRTNQLLVEVRDNRATVFVVNNSVKTQIFTFTDDALRSHRRVGLITGSWQWTPVESRFDNFKLERK